MADVTIPAELWDEDIEGAVSVWFFENGDQVTAGDTLCEVMAEKVSFEIEAPATGALTIVAPAEEPVNKGDVIARIG